MTISVKARYTVIWRDGVMVRVPYTR